MQDAMTTELRTAVEATLALLSRAQEAATGASAEDFDALMVGQRLQTAHTRLGLVDPDLVTAAAQPVDLPTMVTPSLGDCRRWLTDAAHTLDTAVQSESTLLPAGLLTARVDITEAIDTLDAVTRQPR